MKLLLLAVCLLFLHAEGHSYGSWYGSRPWYGDYWYGGGSRGPGGYKGYGGYGGLYKGYGNHHRHRRNAENDIKIHVSGMTGGRFLPAEPYEGGHPGHLQPHSPLHHSQGPRHHEPPTLGHGHDLQLNDRVALPGHREHQRAPGHGPREQVSHDPFKLQHRGPSPTPVDHSSRQQHEPRHPEPRPHHEPRHPEPFYPPRHEQEVDHYDILAHQSLSKPPMPTQVIDRDHSYENVKEAGFTPFLFNNKEAKVDYPADMHGVPQQGPHHGPLHHPQGPPRSGQHERHALPEQASRPEHQLIHESGHRVAGSVPQEQPEHMTWPGHQGPRHQGPPLRHQPEQQGWSEHQQPLTHVSGHHAAGAAPQEQPGHRHQGPPPHHRQPAWPRHEERRPDHGPRHHEQSSHHRDSSSHRDSDFVEFINEEDGLHDSNSKPEEWLESLEH